MTVTDILYFNILNKQTSFLNGREIFASTLYKLYIFFKFHFGVQCFMKTHFIVK